MVAPKISIIGAGSAVFSLSLVRDICLTPNLQGSTVSLMDIDPERLDAVYDLCRRYAAEVGIDLRLEKTIDRRRTLEGADFVINTALVGGHRRLQEGMAIAADLGYRYGSYHVMHDEGFWINYYQFRLFEEVIRDMLEICPDAWCLQVANPVLAATTYLGRKYPQAKVVGLCHGYSGVYHLAHVLGLDEREHLTFELPGVNHFIWLTRLYYKGEDVFPLVDRWIEEEAPRFWESCGASNDLGPKAVDLYRRFGAFPIGDTCTPGGGAWPWWYHTDAEAERRWQEDPAAWWQGYFRGCERTVADIKRVAEDTSSPVTAYFPPKASGETMVPMIESIACDIPRVYIGNIANMGQLVPGVPEDFSVEVPVLASRRGIQGIRTHGLPDPLLSYILRDRVAPINIELDAYEQGSRELLHQLVMMDPWTRSEAQTHREERTMESIGIGMAGYGMIGRVHSLGYRSLPVMYAGQLPPVRLAAVCTSCAETAEVAAAEAGFGACCSGLEALLARDDVQVVDIVAPNDLHRPLALAAMAAGKHVYCEKPLALNAGEARELAAAAERAGVCFGMTFNYRFVPAVMCAHELLASGALGEVYAFRSVFLHGGYQDPARPMSWRLRRARAGGGALYDLGSHAIDLMRYLLGEFAEVRATLHTYITERPVAAGAAEKAPVEVDDAAWLEVRLESGARGTIEASRYATGTLDDLRFEIHGRDGALRFNLMDPGWLDYYDARRPGGAFGGERGWTRLETMQHYPDASSPPTRTTPGWARTHAANQYAFLKAVAEGVQPSPSITDGLRTQLILEAAQESDAAGAWVPVSWT